MKKIISLILTLILMLSCVLSVGAFSPHEPDSPQGQKIAAIEAEYKVILSDYITEQTDKETAVIVRYLRSCEINNEEHYIFGFFTDADIEKESFYRMGIYAFVCERESPVFKEGFAVYNLTEKEWYPLSYLYGKDNEMLDYICELDAWSATNISNQFNYITHFALWGLPDISIATIIQKLLAGIDCSDLISENEVQYLDVDNDGDITIKDATTLQKYLAGFEIEVENSVV